VLFRSKQVLEYDDVMNKQREVIYRDRRMVLRGENLKDRIMEMIAQVVRGILDIYANEKVFQEEWDLDGLVDRVNRTFALASPVTVTRESLAGLRRPELEKHIVEVARKAYEEREALIGPERMRALEKLVMLRIIDSKWMDHLQAMDDLREGIGLRAYGQRNPLQEYQIEGWQMFEALKVSIQEDIVTWMFRVGVDSGERQPKARHYRISMSGSSGQDEQRPRVEQRRVKKVGRNDPCPCGSGKKYKKCCGRSA